MVVKSKRRSQTELRHTAYLRTSLLLYLLRLHTYGLYNALIDLTIYRYTVLFVYVRVSWAMAA